MPVLTANEQIQLCKNVLPVFFLFFKLMKTSWCFGFGMWLFPTPPYEGRLFCETTMLLPLWTVRIEMLWCSFSGYHTLLSSYISVKYKQRISISSRASYIILYDTVLRLPRFNLNFEKQPGTYFFIFFVRTGIIERKIGEVWHIRSIDPMSLLLSRLFFSN